MKTEFFAVFPKLIHLNLRYNKLSTLNTTVMSRLANVLNPEYFKRNRWVCDSRFYETYSWCSDLGDRVKCK